VHSAQTLEPVGLYLPAAHAAQPVEPVIPEKKPAGQSVQALLLVWASPAEYLPTPQ